MASLRPERDLFATVVDTAGSLICVFDRGSRLIAFNRACEETSGYTFAEVDRLGLERLIAPEELASVRSVFAAVRHGIYPIRHENHWVRKDGERRLVAWTNTAVFDESGELAFLVGTGLDVTEQRQAERLVRESEERFRTMVDSAPVMVWMADEHRQHLFLNRAWLEFRGATSEDEIAANGWAGIHPDDIDGIRALLDDAYERQLEYQREYRLQRADGAYRVILDRAVPQHRPDGSFAGLLGIAVDITEQREAEHVLRASEERLRAVLDSTPAVVWMTDEQQLVTFFNDAWFAFTGRSAEEDMGRGWEEPTHPDDLPGILEAYDAAYASRQGYQLEYRLRHVDGNYRWVLERARPRFDENGAFAGLTGTTVDITDRRDAEDALRRRDAIMQAVAETAERLLRAGWTDDAIDVVLERLGQAADVSRAYVFENIVVDGELRCRQRHEWTAEGVTSELGNPLLQSLAYYPGTEEALAAGHAVAHHVRDLPLDLRRIEEAQGNHSVLAMPIFVGETWWGLLGADECRVEREWSPSEIEALRVAGRLLGAGIERRQAEEALRQSEARFHDLAESVDEGFWLDTADYRSLYANRAYERIIGHTREEIFANRSLIRESVHPDDRPAVFAAYDCYAEHPYDIQYRIVRPSGEVRWIRDRTFLLRDDKGAVARVAGIVLDITDVKLANEERRALEEQMRHAQKLESLGVLAGGIAHDFNNLLMGMLGNAGLALSELPEGSSARSTVEQIETAALRAAELTNQMLAYAGKGRFVVAPLDLSRVVEEMAHLLTAAISKKAVLRFELENDLPAVEADATQLRQLAMNLITNASDAIGDDNGVIVVRTGTMRADRAYLAGTWAGEALDEGTYVYMEVADTGAGMDEDTRARIFEPFFTTKFTGRGLGMAGALGIVRGHGGAVRVESEPGSGTVVRVLLPGAEEPAVAPPGVPSLPAGAPEPRGTVLVVDDEEAVRSVARVVLERSGFTVLTACDGLEGLETFRERASEIDVLLLDLTMPALSGEEVLAAVRAEHPDTRVVLTSGYTEEEIRTRLANGAETRFIQKPYRPAQLVEIMRDALRA